MTIVSLSFCVQNKESIVATSILNRFLKNIFCPLPFLLIVRLQISAVCSERALEE